ncbi:hypothetical protein M9H77_12522 [Catharanthus roseus]|uniref:Uncharacterized protein n=1 Tax=Catharanthus roseus TaxID=4058 RepID=A0ACC0BHV1_CATRO|nr:hypothetical protein M9H77_12522 [Catharanthus roseus]
MYATSVYYRILMPSRRIARVAAYLDFYIGSCARQLWEVDPLAHLVAIWCTSFDYSQLPTHTLVTYRDQLDFLPSDQIQLRGNDHTYWGTQHASHVKAWDQWRPRLRDGPALAIEVLSYPSDEYIRWYRGITRVYIGNPANVIPIRLDTSLLGWIDG